MRYTLPLICTLFFTSILPMQAVLSGDTLRSSRISPHKPTRYQYNPANDTIIDNAIVLPEILEEQVDSVLIDWFEKAYPTAEKNRSFSGENISYPDSVYVRRLATLPTAIELPYNQVVRKYIDLYTQRRRESVEYMLGLSNFYFPIFEQELEAQGLPHELKYLPIIESALNPEACSRAGATGLWQFMLATGKTMGLTINSLIDERCDPVRSSKAAALYLKKLYEIYQDWPLAIAAYNCGPGTVNKAIKRARGATDYWAIYYQLPKETRGYVPAFIGAIYAMNYYKEHNISPVNIKFTTSTDTVQVARPIHLGQIAEVLSLPIQEIRDLNPVYRRDLVPADPSNLCTLRLPTPYLYSFIERQDSIATFKADSLLKRITVEPGGGKAGLKSGIAYGGDAVQHRVKSGETLSLIAKKYRVNIRDIKEWNNLKSDRLSIKQRLTIYK